MKFILHIGYHKTGSTAIQQSIALARDALIGSGIYVPLSKSKWHGLPDLAWSCFSGRLPWADVEPKDPVKLLDAWKSEAESHACSAVLISSEELCRLDLEPIAFASLQAALEERDVSIIGYTRDPLAFILSRYRHEVQNGAEIRSISDFMRSEAELLSADFRHRTSIWEKAFGDRAVFHDYTQSMPHGDIVPHFFSLISDGRNLMLCNSEQQAYAASQEAALHPALLDLRRYITAACPTESQGPLVDDILSLSRSLNEHIPVPLSLAGLISACNISREAGASFASVASVCHLIFRSDCNDDAKAKLLCALLTCWQNVQQAARLPDPYVVHLLFPPQSTFTEILALLESRYA